MTSGRASSIAVLASVLLLLGLAACGGEGGGGGGGDLAAEAAESAQLMDDVESLPDRAATDEQFVQELAAVRDRVQQQIQDVASADASEEQGPQRERLASRLRELRTQLGRVSSLAAGGNVEDAAEIVVGLSALDAVRNAADEIQSGG